jgi:hypothetical protein
VALPSQYQRQPTKRGFNTAFGAPLVATVSGGYSEPVGGGQVIHGSGQWRQRYLHGRVTYHFAY